MLQVALDDPHTSAHIWRSTAKELLACNDEQRRLIEALLALASSETGLDHSEATDLSDVCQSVLARAGLDSDRLGLQMEVAIRSAPLEGDPRLIERLVANLIDNAVRHSVAGGRVEISTGTTDGRAVLLVTNTGPLIPPSEVDRLFQPFQRLDPRRTQNRSGHGLGLSLVQAIATTHHASIVAHPRSDGGMSVTVSFPLPICPAVSPGRTSRARWLTPSRL